MSKEFSAKVDFALFTNNNRTTDKHPNRKGTIEMSKALLQEMVTCAKRGEQPLLDIAAWENTSKDGKTQYLSCKMGIDSWKMNKAKDAKTEAPESFESEPKGSDDIFGNEEDDGLAF